MMKLRSPLAPSRTIAVRLALAALGACALPVLVAAASAPPAVTDSAVVQRAAQLLNDPSSPVLGNPRGDVAVVEFFDYDCPYCKAVEPRLQQLLSSDRGVKLILKEFPILTPESLIAAKASLAAMKQHRYREFHDALMGYRGEWNEAVIFDTAGRVGLNLPRLRKDMAAPGIDAEIIANFNLARGLRIFQTPGFIVGDHILTGPSAQIDFPQVVAAARGR